VRCPTAQFRQFASSLCRGHWPTSWRLSRPSCRGTPRGAFDAAHAELRQLICEGFEEGITREKLAEAAGLSLARVYQIRDGRR
jgi:hypothetical protein